MLPYAKHGDSNNQSGYKQDNLTWKKPLVDWACSSINTEKKGAEPFWKMVPLWRVEPFFPSIIMFEKKTMPLTKVVPFAKTATLFGGGSKMVPSQ